METSVEQETLKNYRRVHITAHDEKIKLNDYVFDERQNLQEDLMQLDLKQLVKDNGVGNVPDLVNERNRSCSPNSQHM